MDVLKTVLTLVVALSVATPVFAAEHADYGIGEKKPVPRRVFWGHTHINTDRFLEDNQ